jgi:Leucine-rich repeat (LRR) protein
MLLKAQSWITILSLGLYLQVQAATDCGSVSEIPPAECDALVALYNSTDGANWSDNTDWNMTDMPCSWYGVTCSGGHVTSLSLGWNNLSGFIPADLGDLENLEELSLWLNELSGSIPVELSDLSNLVGLELWGNYLSGPIPTELGSLSHLESLLLSQNDLSDHIPVELGNLSALQRLALDSNQLSGPIPAELGNLTNLWNLSLNENELCGEIPIELMNLTNLFWLTLDNNHLSASDPDLIAWLDGLNPSWSNTQTPCPSTLLFSSATYSVAEDGRQADIVVKRVYASDGEVSVECSTSDDTAIAGSDYTAISETLIWNDGDVDDKICTVDIIDDSDQEGDETFIVSLGNPSGGAVLGMPNTAVVTIIDDDGMTPVDCATVDEIPSTECEALVALYESTDGANWTDNTGWNMTDTPCSWHGVTCKKGRVTELDLSSNELEGSIPTKFFKLKKLTALNLSDNLLESSKFPKFYKLKKLKTFKLNDNEFCGEISTKFMKLTKLKTLRLDNNHLTASNSKLLDWIEGLNPGWLDSQTPCP